MVVLLVLLVIISFLTIDYFVQRAEQMRLVRSTPDIVNRLALTRPSAARKYMGKGHLAQAPGGLFLSPWHVWAQVEPSGSVRIGVDRFLLSFLGGVDCIYVLPDGAEVHQGGPLVMLRHGQRALRVRSPIDGVITAINDKARRVPHKIAADPFEKGWIYRISPTRLSDSLKKMVIAEDAAGWMAKEFSRLGGLLKDATGTASPALTTLADGGEPIAAAFDLVGDKEWEKLVGDFFSVAGSDESSQSKSEVW